MKKNIIIFVLSAVLFCSSIDRKDAIAGDWSTFYNNNKTAVNTVGILAILGVALVGAKYIYDKTDEKPKKVEPRDSSNLESFTIVTQNLFHSQKSFSRREKNLDKRISTFLPDIVAFQEAWSFSGSRRSLYKHFTNVTGYRGSYCKMTEVKVYDDGIATLSPFTQKEIGCKELPGSSYFTKRMMSILKLSLGGQDVVILNVHLSPDDMNDCIKSVAMIADEIKAKWSDTKVIVLGDFNMTYESQFMKPLVDLGFTSVDDGENPTRCTFCKESPFASTGQSRTIDFIFYRKKDFELMQFDLWEETTAPISDHCGLWAKFKIL